MGARADERHDGTGTHVLLTFANEDAARRAIPKLHEEGIPLALLQVVHPAVAVTPPPSRVAHWIAMGGVVAGAVAGGLAFGDPALLAPVMGAGCGAIGAFGGLLADRRRRRRYDVTRRATVSRAYEVTCPSSAVTEEW
ncbi:MAG TPA: hypothetical protein VH914_06570 [Acidimicrobiia bacterium]|jgi:hypothetical protein|nr:hypothetical protein [Acidimicrobiia bacterium]